MHIDVIDTDVICIAVSLTPLWQAQWSHGNRFVDYLREFEAIFEKPLTRVSTGPGEVV
jgi:hypothetical protein